MYPIVFRVDCKFVYLFFNILKTTVFKIYIVLDWVRSGGFEKKIGPKWRRKISSSKPGKQNLKKDITALLLKILC